MTGAISRGLIGGATGAGIMVLAGVWACGTRRTVEPAPEVTPPAAPRIVPLSRVVLLETSGPPPSDTSVSFPAGQPHVIILRHGPPENIVFARLSFSATAFADTGRIVTIEVHPRPGVYGVDLATSLPLRTGEAILVFEYARYFSAPAQVRRVYGNDVAFERALAIGRLLPNDQIELLPSTRPAPDNLAADLPAAATYLVAAPQ